MALKRRGEATPFFPHPSKIRGDSTSGPQLETCRQLLNGGIITSKTFYIVWNRWTEQTCQKIYIYFKWKQPTAMFFLLVHKSLIWIRIDVAKEIRLPWTFYPTDTPVTSQHNPQQRPWTKLHPIWPVALERFSETPIDSFAIFVLHYVAQRVIQFPCISICSLSRNLPPTPPHESK